ncbi:DUF2878 family protein [Candidatus Micrarchaeota archaeon]|nr:DUF2878 family protein [Candidatus Micrarchaeota archaeon]
MEQKIGSRPGNAIGKILLLWPLVFIPITLYAVTQFGNPAGNAVLGALFLYLLAFKSGLRARRLMVALAVLGMIFETANVAAGIYKYSGTIGAPVWIALGWAILGWWVSELMPQFSKIGFKPAFVAASAALVAFPFLNHTLGLSTPIAIAGLYALSLSSQMPFAAFAFTSLFAMLAEYSGTAFGAWKYFDLSGSGVAVPPDLAGLAMGYSVVMAFCFWISGYEKGVQ